MARAYKQGRQSRAKPHCSKGHPFDADTWTSKTGWRYCRICGAEVAAKRRMAAVLARAKDWQPKKRFYPPAAERLFAAIEYDTNGGCWLWSGGPKGFGYGQIMVEGRRQSAHRLSWLLHRGDPGSLFVCHKCDIPACVNPDHLFLGTALDNARDMIRKGRARYVGKGRRRVIGKAPNPSPQSPVEETR